MPKTMIKFGNISKRLASRNAKPKTNVVSECNSIEKSYRIINNTLDNKSGGMNVIKINTDRLLESLADSNLADKYIFYPISIAEKINTVDSNYSDYIIDRYCKLVLPYVANVGSILEVADSYKLSNKQKDTLIREANIYNICDRILNNHNTISKRFNLEDIVLKNKYNMQYATESVCTIIDTYNREPYQKMNICLEEMFYIIEKNKINCNKIDIINSIIEYFLLSNDEISERTYTGMKKCINESSIISEDEVNDVIFLSTNRDTNTNSNIRSIIASYYTGNKSIESLTSTITDCINSDTLDIVYNFSALLDFILQVYKFDRIYDTELEGVMSNLEVVIANRLTNIINDAEISRDDLGSIILHIVSKIKEVDSILATKSDIGQPRLADFIKHMKSILATISPYYDNLYTNDNINTINTLENCTNEITVNEGKLFKAHNIFTAVRNLDKYLGDKCKEVVNKLIGKDKNKPSLRQKINDVLYGKDDTGSVFDLATKKGVSNVKKVVSSIANTAKAALVKESYNPYEYISEETKMFDIILADIPFKEEELSDIHDQIASICKEFNYILEHSTDTYGCKIYYIINPGNISLHLSENARYILDDDAIKAIREARKPDIESSLLKLAEASEVADFVDSISNKDIESSLFSYFTNKDMDINKFDTILEGLSLIGTSNTIVEKFANKYLDHKYYSLSEDIDIDSESKKINALVESYHPEDEVPDSIKLEAYLAVDALLEAYDEDDFDEDNIAHNYEPTKKHSENDDPYANDDDNDKDSDNDEESEEDLAEVRKNPYKGLNLKSIKLCIMGLKSKFRNMSQKEKELSKNVDASFKHLVDSFKNAMISDSRESVIKGSVIPSFSRCLKIGIPAAIGLGTGIINPGVAAITAIGSFALSKHLTKKERILLLDEIETELEVVDKEISMAEREEDMKKYRALLQYKKNLQRQYQRIRYNVKVGKDIMPGSNAGMPGDRNGY